MRVAVKTLQIEKRRPASKRVTITFGCSASYEAAILYDDLVRAAKKGRIAVRFNGEVIEETGP